MTSNTSATPGPILNETIAEVQGIFPDDATLQDAIARLNLAGFDRADLSLPHATPLPHQATPESGAAAPTSDIDQQQLRALGAGTAAAVGAVAAAGITIATGGLAAAAVGAALLGGVAAGGATAVVTGAGDRAMIGDRDDLGAAGNLVLAARVTDAAKTAAAETAMLAAGASRVEAIRRVNAGLGAPATVEAKPSQAVLL